MKRSEIPEKVLRQAWCAGMEARRKASPPSTVPDKLLPPMHLWNEDPAGYSAGLLAAFEVMSAWVEKSDAKGRSSKQGKVT